jgi:hypothetical protein
MYQQFSAKVRHMFSAGRATCIEMAISGWGQDRRAKHFSGAQTCGKIVSPQTETGTAPLKKGCRSRFH